MSVGSSGFSWDSHTRAQYFLEEGRKDFKYTYYIYIARTVVATYLWKGEYGYLVLSIVR